MKVKNEGPDGLSLWMGETTCIGLIGLKIRLFVPIEGYTYSSCELEFVLNVLKNFDLFYNSTKK
jgi:hypothetical protein